MYHCCECGLGKNKMLESKREPDGYTKSKIEEGVRMEKKDTQDHQHVAKE